MTDPTPTPTTITGTQMQAACRALGLDPVNVRAVTMTLDGVAVDRYLLDEHGAKYVRRRRRWWLWLPFGDRYEIATTVDVHPVDWTKEDR